jgi:hypothetical protein
MFFPKTIANVDKTKITVFMSSPCRNQIEKGNHINTIRIKKYF